MKLKKKTRDELVVSITVGNSAEAEKEVMAKEEGPPVIDLEESLKLIKVPFNGEEINRIGSYAWLSQSDEATPDDVPLTMNKELTSVSISYLNIPISKTGLQLEPFITKVQTKKYGKAQYITAAEKEQTFYLCNTLDEALATIPIIKEQEDDFITPPLVMDKWANNTDKTPVDFDDREAAHIRANAELCKATIEHSFNLARVAIVGLPRPLYDWEKGRGRKTPVDEIRKLKDEGGEIFYLVPSKKENELRAFTMLSGAMAALIPTYTND